MINSTWPHPGHQLVNAALDGTPAQVMLPCLFTHLPKAVHLVIIEFGSLALHLHHPSVEAVVRRLLSLRPPPAVVFLTVRGLCHRTPRRTNETIRYALDSHWELYRPGESTAWSRAEAEFDAVCRAYSVGCLSLWEATIGPMLSRARGFALSDVSLDCLHPFNGRRGTDFLVDMLVHWLRRSRAEAAEGAGRGRGGGGGAPRQASRGHRLPAPLHGGEAGDDAAAANASDARCYSFADQDSLRSPISQAMRNVRWQTSSCGRVGCTQWKARGARCAAVRATGAFALPRATGWAYCHHALGQAPAAAAAVSPHRRGGRRGERVAGRGGKASGKRPKAAVPKVSPGVVATEAGAALELTVDSRVGPSGRADAAARVRVGIEHLVSYERMGVGRLTCVRRCRCEPLSIDAHRTSAVRNETVFVRTFFEMVGAHEDCALRLLVLNETQSGGHKFKVRSLTLTPVALAAGGSSREGAGPETRAEPGTVRRRGARPRAMHRPRSGRL